MLLEIVKPIMLGYLLAFLMLLIIGLIRPIRITGLYKGLAFLASVALAFWAYQLEAGRKLDLYRQFQSIEWVAGNSKNFIDAVLHPNDAYTGLYGLNAFFYLTTKLGTVHWYPAVATFFTTFILSACLLDYLKMNGYTSKEYAYGLLLIYMGMPMLYVFSSVRNALAISIIIFALYQMIYKNNTHRILHCVLIFLAATIHPASLFIFPPILVTNLKPKLQKMLRFAALLAFPAIFAVSRLLASSPISTLRYIGMRVLFYENVQYQYDRPEMIANIAVFLTIYIVGYVFEKNREVTVDCGLERKYLNAYIFLGYLMIGCSVHRDFTLRIGYLMGILAVPLVLRINKAPVTEKDRVVRVLMNIGIIVCMAKVYYDTYYGISRWDFGW